MNENNNEFDYLWFQFSGTIKCECERRRNRKRMHLVERKLCSHSHTHTQIRIIQIFCWIVSEYSSSAISDTCITIMHTSLSDSNNPSGSIGEVISSVCFAYTYIWRFYSCFIGLDHKRVGMYATSNVAQSKLLQMRNSREWFGARAKLEW